MSPSTPPTLAADPPHRRVVTRVGVALALAALVGVGAVIRAHGFTRLDLWFDDAWAAAPARVGWGKAVHMVLTAPGYGLALRLWIRLDPATTWFTQLPSFVLGVLAVPAVYALLRVLRNSRPVALLGAALAAADPILVQYSTRLKEYNFDLLAACALLALAERARRRPSRRSFGALALTSVVVVFFSAGSVAVVAGAWLALGAVVLRDRAQRRAYVGSIAGVAVGALVVWYAFLRRLPPVLNFNWRRRGYLLDYRSLGRFERTTTMVFGGFLHGVLGYPVPPAFFRGRPGLHAPSAAALGAVALALAIGVPLISWLRRREPGPALAAALSLLVAVLLAVADRFPLGDGRTDEALYPAFFVCLAAIVAAAIPWCRAHLARRAGQAVAVALAGTVGIGSIAFGVAHQAIYPTISLRVLWSRLKPLVRPGEVVFVDTFNSFGWCYYELTKCTTTVGGQPPWPQGFRPVSASPDVFIPTHYGIPEPELDERQSAPNVRGIWYVGFTYGTYDVGAGPKVWNYPVPTYMLTDLRKDGWRPAPPEPGTRVLGVTHCYAQLFVRASTLTQARRRPA